MWPVAPVSESTEHISTPQVVLSESTTLEIFNLTFSFNSLDLVVLSP